MIDVLIVIGYFAVIMITALSGRSKQVKSADSYFLSNRNLKWPSIALSTIATNIQGYQFLGMMGSAYLFGLAQANLEINAVQGILLATFVFVPLYLKDRVITITQFIKKRLGEKVGLAYTIANIALFSTITLGAALFWGAYAAELVFEEYLNVLHEDKLIRVGILIIGLGIFSAIYTYLGGLGAVVRTDIIQFSILLVGGFVVLFVAIHHLGGWGKLYTKTPELMHLHLPADHETLPWIHIFGLFFLNINYWCANQTVMQRSLAAKSLKHAQVGLMVGGLMKYVMALIIIVPGIALYGILKDQGGLPDPDMAFPYLVSTYLPIGIKGIILCALFASLMSTVDSTFNSLATLWSIDIYKVYINPQASEVQVVGTGRKTILVTLFTGITMGLVLLFIKFNNSETAFTHTLNQLRYFVNCGIVVLIVGAVIFIRPSHRGALLAFIVTVPFQFLILWIFPDMNYFMRAFWVIISGLAMLALLSWPVKTCSPASLFKGSGVSTGRFGWILLASLIMIHVVFH